MKLVFEAIVPGWKGSEMPKEFPFHVRFLLRASIVLVHVFALKKHGLTFGMLKPENRIQIIEELYHHPNATIRSLVQFWKLTALMTQCN
ncbi:MAG: hypothetical protein IPN22_02280 [Bacteroidetes bacterium]|nr:hypothetical protein [Bacteroidota bacterium]